MIILWYLNFETTRINPNIYSSLCMMLTREASQKKKYEYYMVLTTFGTPPRLLPTKPPHRVPPLTNLRHPHPLMRA